MKGRSYVSGFYEWRRKRAAKLATVQAALDHVNRAVKKAMSPHVDEKTTGYSMASTALISLVDALWELQG